MSTVVFAVGARPNFVKMAPVIEAVGRRGLFRQLVVHTGQHYDERMSAEILDGRLGDAGAGHHEGHHLLAALLVGGPDCRALAHRRVPGQGRFHLGLLQP